MNRRIRALAGCPPEARMIRLFGAAAALVLSGGAAWAGPTTYVFTGAPYDSLFGHPVDPCPAGICTDYTAGQNVVLSMTTASPLGANLPGATDISGQVIAFSASDGVNVIASTDARSRLLVGLAETDATGALATSGTIVSVIQWASPGSVHVVGDRFAFISAGSGTSYVVNNVSCATIGSGDTCLSFGTDGGESSASATTGAWVQITPVIVPTLGEWAMVALAAMIGGFGLAALQRRRRIA